MIYVLMKLESYGTCKTEELLQASLNKEEIMSYAEKYHSDCLSDEITIYNGLVMYECNEIDEPYLAYEWNI